MGQRSFFSLRAAAAATLLVALHATGASAQGRVSGLVILDDPSWSQLFLQAQSRAEVVDLFARLGTVVPLPEAQIDAATAPVGEDYVYDINLADVSEVWRRGSGVSSWLLDLAATAFAENPTLSNYSGRVSDSGEGRWTLAAALIMEAASTARDYRARYIERQST